MKKSVCVLAMLLLVVTACASKPEAVFQTVVHESTVEVPVTVEVTRLVEVKVTRDVTREIEVVQEVQVDVEVTRILEKLVTATITPKPEPTITSTPAPNPVVQPTRQPEIASLLLQSMRLVRERMDRFEHMLMSTSLSCQEMVDLYDTVASAPTYDVSGNPFEVQNAYGLYRAGTDVFLDGTWDFADNCRNAIANQANTSIPPIHWDEAHTKLREAKPPIDSGIEILEHLVGE